jgi:hypothetical protein
MKFEFEEFSNIEDVFMYLVSVAPYMKQVLPISSYKGYVFSIVPLTTLGWWSLIFLLKNTSQSLPLNALIRIILLF